MVAGCGSKGAQNIVASHDDESTTSLPLRLDPIHAQFIQAKYETDYSISSPDEEGLPFVGDNHFTWTLSLELVDTAGSPSPEMAGSGAAVDPACNDPDEIGRAQLGMATSTGGPNSGTPSSGITATSASTLVSRRTGATTSSWGRAGTREWSR
jgi:hypothetical protein